MSRPAQIPGNGVTLAAPPKPPTPRFRSLSRDWLEESSRHGYSYNFTWMGRPIIQYPQDILAMQELIWKVQPRWIVETGIAHGGSLVFSASILQLVAGPGRVLGIDIDIRPHNRAAIEAHPMAHRIEMLQGSSIDEAVVQQVRQRIVGEAPIMVVLDSNHTHDHVLRELELYSPLVTRGSYLVVFDTAVEDLSPDLFQDRPWGVGNNPKTAVQQFLQNSNRFEIDRELENRLMVSAAPSGYLRCIDD